MRSVVQIKGSEQPLCLEEKTAAGGFPGSGGLPRSKPRMCSAGNSET